MSIWTPSWPWWRARPVVEQRQLYSEDRVVPQVAWLDLAGSFDPAALLAAFPRPDGIDEEQLARSYYDKFKSLRVLDTAANTGEGDDADAQKDPFLAFETVRDQALAEARIEAALSDLIRDLEQRGANGEAIDLGVEAAKERREGDTSPHPVSRHVRRRPRSIRGPLPRSRVMRSGHPARITHGAVVPTITWAATDAPARNRARAATTATTMLATSPIRTSHSPHRGERRTSPRARASVTVTGQPG